MPANSALPNDANLARKGYESVYQFTGKVGGKLYGRGMFISMNGFSDYVVESLVKGKALNMIMVDGSDIADVIEGRITLVEMIDRKVKAAQTRGEIYVNPLTEKRK